MYKEQGTSTSNIFKVRNLPVLNGLLFFTTYKDEDDNWTVGIFEQENCASTQTSNGSKNAHALNTNPNLLKYPKLKFQHRNNIYNK
jgi:hypothetical protein